MIYLVLSLHIAATLSLYIYIYLVTIHYILYTADHLYNCNGESVLQVGGSLWCVGFVKGGGITILGGTFGQIFVPFCFDIFYYLLKIDENLLFILLKFSSKKHRTMLREIFTLISFPIFFPQKT